MAELSIGSGILSAVVFVVLIGLTIFTIILWKDAIEAKGEPFSIIAFTVLTITVGIFLAAILGFINLRELVN